MGATRARSPLGSAKPAGRRRKTIKIAVLSILGCGLIVLGCFTAVHWPYRYREIHPLLVEVFGSQVKVTNYHRVYLPHPGFVATGLIVTRASAPNQPPLGTVETLYVQGRWRDLLMLRRRVHLVEMTGVHIVIPPKGSRASQEDFPAGSASGFSGPSTAIELLRLHNSVLEVQYDDGKSLRFAVRELKLANLQKDHPVGYVLDMENPMPAGHIAARGTFGPLNANDVGATPVSGQFTFNQVKLSDLGELHGTLASTGRFNGSLRSIQASAVSITPDFAVADGQPTPVRGSVQCTVNGTNGDVFLNAIEVTNGHSTIHAHGQVAGSPKIANLDIAVDRGRAEELLRPFIHERVPVIGVATLYSHAWVGPVGKPFLQRLRVEGRFDMPAAQAADPNVEHNLSAFSAREQKKSPGNKGGADPASNDVLSSLQGPATIRNGVIATSGLLFQIPGAHVRLTGTFNLENEAAHLAGTLKMDESISHATTGWKSVLLKPLSPFFKRNRHPGSQIPIAVVGTPGHYRVEENISHTK